MGLCVPLGTLCSFEFYFGQQILLSNPQVYQVHAPFWILLLHVNYLHMCVLCYVCKLVRTYEEMWILCYKKKKVQLQTFPLVPGLLWLGRVRSFSATYPRASFLVRMVSSDQRKLSLGSSSYSLYFLQNVCLKGKKESHWLSQSSLLEELKGSMGQGYGSCRCVHFLHSDLDF